MLCVLQSLLTRPSSFGESHPFLCCVVSHFIWTSISATDWLEESMPDEPSWRIEDTIRLTGILAEHGVDVLDVSTGGVHPQQKKNTFGLYQAHFSAAAKKVHGGKILVSAVGSITNGKIAQECLDKGEADIIFVGRTF